MADLNLLLEANRRGLLPPEQAAVLAEAQKRNILPAKAAATELAGEQAIADAAHIKEHPYGFGRAAAQPPTLGLADEIEAAIRPGEYGKNLSDLNRSKAIYEREHPGAALGAEAVGTAAGIAGTLGAGALAKAPRIAQTVIGRTAAAIPPKLATPAITATTGAGYGAGTAKPGERFSGAVTGGATGLALGAAIPAVAGGAKSAGRATRDVVQSYTNPQRYLDRQLSGAIANDAIDPVTLRARLQANPNTSMYEAGGENIRDLAIQAAGAPGPGRTAIKQKLDVLATDAAKKVEAELTKAFGPEDFYDTRKMLGDRLGTEAAPLYDAAYAANPSVMTPEIAAILGRPGGQAALKRAQTLMLDEGFPAPQGNGLDLRTLDMVKRELDDVARRAYRTGADNEGRIASGMAKELRSELDKADSTGTYAKARALWSGTKATLDALDDGKAFLKMAPQEIKAALADMSAAEQRAFRIGVGRSVLDIVDRGSDQKVLRNNYTVRQIEAALPPADFDAVVEATIRSGSAQRLSKEVASARGREIPPDPRIARAVGRLGVIAGASLPGTHPLLAAAAGRQMATASIPRLQTSGMAEEMLLPGQGAQALGRLGRPSPKSLAPRLPSRAAAMAATEMATAKPAEYQIDDEEIRKMRALLGR